MRLLVTVGTTPFDSLIRWADKELGVHEVHFQIASGYYKPQNGKWFRFGEINPLYAWSDIVITHAGAGSVYMLLEQGKKMLVIPNLERRDPHQRELARYIQTSHYAHVIWDLSEIRKAVDDAWQYISEPYIPYRFCKGEEIKSILLSDFPSS